MHDALEDILGADIFHMIWRIVDSFACLSMALPEAKEAVQN